MKQSLQVIAGHRFTERDFVGGDAALDFINTVAGRDQSAAAGPAGQLRAPARMGRPRKPVAGKAAPGACPPSPGRARSRTQGAGSGESAARDAFCDFLCAGRRPRTAFSGACPPPRALDESCVSAIVQVCRWPACHCGRWYGRRLRPYRVDRRLAGRGTRAAGPRRAASHLSGNRLRLALHRQLEGGPATLV